MNMSLDQVREGLQKLFNAGPGVACNAFPSAQWIEAITAHLAAEAKAAPVAWQLLGTSSLDGSWPTDVWKPCDDPDEARKNGFEVRPLYAHPQPAAQDAVSVSDDRFELAMRVREALDRKSCPSAWMVIAVEAITGAKAPLREKGTVPPRWYSEGEIASILRSMNYSELIVAELSPWFFRHLQSAFNKGFQKAQDIESFACGKAEQSTMLNLANGFQIPIIRSEIGYRVHPDFVAVNYKAAQPSVPVERWEELMRKWKEGLSDTPITDVWKLIAEHDSKDGA
jgi:hypothetical protein